MILDFTIPEILFPKITFIISNVSFYRIVSFQYIIVNRVNTQERADRLAWHVAWMKMVKMSTTFV